MAGIYLHIPYCKQKCHYCNFHFSTLMQTYPALISAMEKEVEMQQILSMDSEVETLYFGGGTPSLLKPQDLEKLLGAMHKNFAVAHDAEITLEANPDDITEESLKLWKRLGINRLSIGIQSFFEDDLIMMNRAHNREQALRCISLARDFEFENLTADLIYAMPHSIPEQWAKNVEIMAGFDLPHLSAYALTVEPKTALEKMIATGKITPVSDERAFADFEYLRHTLTGLGYEHYEISNFAKPEHYSRHNTAYWQGKKYLGLGPAAHSYDGQKRYWNVANNALYIKNIEAGKMWFEEETLQPNDRYNEYIMTGLRTQWGLSEKRLEEEFGPKYHRHFLKEAEPFFLRGLLLQESGRITLSKTALFQADGIVAELFRTGRE